uniref:thymocyte selection-associated high mobility group box protein TOX-like n=1 Tax=Monopterus albus TaxID=43700 RepID=UPI0009B44D49|nr:thymocyte selection-associated high mobility group box protein TOX-like [Monopterus albus]
MGEVDVFSAMDVTVYPPPPQPLDASDHVRLGQLSYPDPAFGANKLDGDTMFLGITEAGLEFTSTNQFRVPQPSLHLSKMIPPNPPLQQWKRDTHMTDTHRLPVVNVHKHTHTQPCKCNTAALQDVFKRVTHTDVHK